MDITSWEAQFAEPEKQNLKLPAASVVAEDIADRYNNKLVWNVQIESWMYYSETSGIWSVEHDRYIDNLIQVELDQRPDTPKRYSWNYVKGIARLLTGRLLIEEWNQNRNLIPLQDGVLDKTTLELKEHAPEYRFTWQLPYKWSERSSGCQPIQDWLYEAMKGDCQLVAVLRAYLNAVVNRRVNLHRFLECIGSGGAEKGTFMSLAMALVGRKNTHSTTLKKLETNRFEAAEFADKFLLLVTNSECYTKQVSQLKVIIVQDLIRYERKGKQQSENFVADCVVILDANEVVQISDYSFSLERRRLVVPFTHQIKTSQQRDLDEEFKPFLPGLLEWVLTMPETEVISLLQDINSNVPSLARMRTNILITTNPIAEWFDTCIVNIPNIKTYVGVAKREKDSDVPNVYQKVNEWLYANYAEFTTAAGKQLVSQRRFSEMLKDLCISQLKLSNIYWRRDNKGSYFEGLVIRCEHHTQPRPITGLQPPDNPPPIPPLPLPSSLRGSPPGEGF